MTETVRKSFNHAVFWTFRLFVMTEWIGHIIKLQVFQVPLDVPQCISASLQLGPLIISQSHVDHTAHPIAVQHTGQAQVDLITYAKHALQIKGTQVILTNPYIH